MGSLTIAFSCVVAVNFANSVLVGDGSCEDDLSVCAVQRIESMEQRLRAIETKQDAYDKALQTQSYAFMASTSSDLVNPANGRTIVFDNVITNVGKAYHSSTGVFMVPVSGTYSFSFHLTVSPFPGHTLRGFIMLNNAVIGHTICDDQDEWTMCSDNSVIHAAVGNDVYVSLGDIHGNNSILGGSLHSHFQGYLIKAD